MKTGILKAGAISKHRAWKQKKMDHIRKEQEKLRAQLLNSAPTRLQSWLDNDAVVDTLIAYGRCHLGLRNEEIESHGFRSRRAMKTVLKKLDQAWAGVASVGVTDSKNDSRLRINIDALELVQSN